MASAFLHRAGMSLPVIQQDRGIRFVQQDMAVWTGEAGTGWSVKTQNSAIPDTLESVVNPAKLFDSIVWDDIY